MTRTMSSFAQEFVALKREAEAALSAVKTMADLETFRTAYLARRGNIPLFLRTLKDQSLEERRRVGSDANKLRARLESEVRVLHARLAKRKKSRLDVSAPGRRPLLGHLHPLTIVRRDIEDTFLGMGFEIVDGPEVEEPKFNFDLLNIPLEHPARDLMDTFWLTDGRLLRTHTSATQARVMTGRTPPFRLLIPGKVFRHEATDATHESTFLQFEGLYVDVETSLAHLKGVLTAAFRNIMRRDVGLRFRPGYFPFVEPGLEVDMGCLACAGRSGASCPVCKGARWLEMMGAGMIHPVVLQNVGVDPRKYRGFAFGGSIDRIAMLRYGITDIRLFWSGDPEFLRQF